MRFMEENVHDVIHRLHKISITSTLLAAVYPQLNSFCHKKKTEKKPLKAIAERERKERGLSGLSLEDVGI